MKKYLESSASKYHKRLKTTAINEALQIPGIYSNFSVNMALALRIIAIVIGTVSVGCSIINIYLLKSFHQDSIVFRHDFLLWLFCFDLSKDLVLTIFPLMATITIDVYNWPIFYNIVGFLTNLTMVGADFIVFFIGLHFALLIFKPSLNILDQKRNKAEGGLFKYRFYIFSFTLAFSTLCSSLAFINFNTQNTFLPDSDEITEVIPYPDNFHITHSSKMGGYKPLVTIVSLPVVPLYYNLFLNWLWRYCILISIIIIYVMIYIKYMKESKINKKRMKNLQQDVNAHINKTASQKQIEDISKEFNQLSYEEFSKKKQQFMKQLYQLFLYPTYYLILWIVPLIESIEEPIQEAKNGPMVPISILSTICHPANGIFDLIIFMAREKPFQNYWSKIETENLVSEYLNNKNRQKMDIEDKWNLCNNTTYGEKGYYYSGNAIKGIIEDNRFIITNHLRISWFYKCYHMMPLRKGIDLDMLEVNYSSNNINASVQDYRAVLEDTVSETDTTISETEMFALVNNFKNQSKLSKNPDLSSTHTNNDWVNQLMSEKGANENSILDQNRN
ncbi:hypothetical protein QEN19_003639 [Hanseniaspora menglaensis]